MQLEVGAILEGKITGVKKFGAFVALPGGKTGMVHISELSWSRVGAADEAVSPGDLVRVKVLGISKNDKGQIRISLSRKQAEGDPWLDAPERLSAGAVVQGKVVRLAPFGAFVELLPGVEGLIHVSEMSWAKRVNKPEEVLSAGETVSVKIKDVNTETRRIALSLRDAEGDATEEVLTMPGRVYMLCVTAFDRLPRSCARRMARLAERAREEGAHVVCLTPDPLYGVTWHEFGTAEVRCNNIDASTMKTMLRADNGLVVLDDGTITSKKNCRDIRP